MRLLSRWRLAALLATVVMGATAFAAPRTWKDKSGKFSIDAELVAVQNGHVVLRSADGRQLTVPIKSLSAEDQALLGGGEPEKDSRRGKAKGGEIVEVAEKFFEDLRSEKRDAVGDSLTTKAQELLKGGKSPLKELPAPEDGKRAVRLGRPKLDDKVAELPAQVRAAGQTHKCKLHLRQEDDQWRIFAMSAMYPGGEKSINFEAEAAAEGEGDPLEALVGKPFQFAGVTIDGKPLDLSRYQGKVVLIDFWATWCGPCREEMPNVFANYQQHYKDGFEVIAVSVDQDLEALAEFVAKAKPPWAVVADNFPGNP
ncbi:MAG: redoxin family protein, partial [Pirellulales bacterium]